MVGGGARVCDAGAMPAKDDPTLGDGLPNKVHPSDHLPLIVTLEIDGEN